MNPLHNTSKVDFEISLKETCFGIIVRFLASKKQFGDWRDFRIGYNCINF